MKNRTFKIKSLMLLSISFICLSIYGAYEIELLGLIGTLGFLLYPLLLGLDVFILGKDLSITGLIANVKERNQYNRLFKSVPRYDLTLKSKDEVFSISAPTADITHKVNVGEKVTIVYRKTPIFSFHFVKEIRSTV